MYDYALDFKFNAAVTKKIYILKIMIIARNLIDRNKIINSQIF